MLLESLRALQLKSNVIVRSNNVALAGTVTSVPGNTRRHSIVFACNTGNVSFTFAGVVYVFPFTTTGLQFIVFKWDDIGDDITQPFTITWGAGANQFYLMETFTEERPEGQ